jgi:hypothetical protein
VNLRTREKRVAGRGLKRHGGVAAERGAAEEADFRVEVAADEQVLDAQPVAIAHVVDFTAIAIGRVPQRVAVGRRFGPASRPRVVAAREEVLEEREVRVDAERFIRGSES